MMGKRRRLCHYDSVTQFQSTGKHQALEQPQKVYQNMVHGENHSSLISSESVSDSSNLIITGSRISVSLSLSQYCDSILKISPRINPGVMYYIPVPDFSLVLNVLRCHRFIKNL